MKYYKITIDKSFIGVVCSGHFVVEDTETNKLFFANETNGQFINYEGKLYRDYWMTPVDTNKIYLNANINEITYDEYNIYKEAINKNQIIEEEEEEIIPIIIPEEETDETIKFLQSSKIAEMSNTCHKIIEAGIDLEIRNEMRHFSLTTQDQLNLMSLNAMAATQELIPYHADGEACIFYTAEEIQQIVAAATAYKIYHTTYYNALKNYINALETIEDIAAITYGVDIPEEYQTDVLKALLANENNN